MLVLAALFFLSRWLYVFAFVLAALCPQFDTQIRAHAEQQQNLVAYCDRMRSQFCV